MIAEFDIAKVDPDLWVYIVTILLGMATAWLKHRNSKFASAVQILADVIERSGKSGDENTKRAVEGLKEAIAAATSYTPTAPIVAKAAQRATTGVAEADNGKAV